MTFSALKVKPTAWPLSLVSFGIPHTNFAPPSPCPVTRQGVRGLIICTDPGLAPQGGCPSTDALDPIDTGRGRRRGGGKQTLAPASRPSSAGWWMSRTSRSLPPKPVESGYNELQSLSKKTVLPGTLPPSSSQAAHEPHSSPRTQASLPPHKHWRSIPDSSRHHLPGPFNFLPWLCRFLPAAHTCRSNRKLAHVACRFITQLNCLCQVAAELYSTWHLTVRKHFITEFSQHQEPQVIGLPEGDKQKSALNNKC